MKEIPITKIIKIDDYDKYKLYAAQQNTDNENPLDVFVEDKQKWHGWNTYQISCNDFNRQFIFSLIDFYPEADMWLFGGVFEVTDRKYVPKSHSYTIREIDEFSSFVGRLKIKFKKPARGRAFLLEKYIVGMEVAEILKEPYSGEVFPGYENINHDLDILIPIFKNEKLDWKGALENVKGVYVIMDKSNGKKYVGSAYGGCGVWSRWSCYIGTGHGYNDELTKIIEQEGFDYAKKNFRISLLEYRPMKVDDNVIIERESFWKEVFLSRGELGYNKN